jgi:secondary thiamine-phosphate synthase enzyme
MQRFAIQTTEREQMLDITGLVQQAVTEAAVATGLAVCFVPHTTAAVTINENADPDVVRDILYKLHKDIPPQDDYRHAEGNSDAHLKASLVGASEQILVEDDRLVLGHWQGIYFCEFDGPRTRQLIVKVARFA